MVRRNSMRERDMDGVLAARGRDSEESEGSSSALRSSVLSCMHQPIQPKSLS
jgi:hypothetical protein